MAIVVIALQVLVGCTMGPRPATPNIQVDGVNTALLSEPEIVIELVRINDAELPEQAWRNVMARLQRHVGRPIRVVDRGSIIVPADSTGAIGEFDWPIYDGDSLVSPEQIGPPEQWSRLQQPQGALVGAFRAPREGGSEVVHPIVAPGGVLLAVLPRERDMWKVTGYCTMVNVLVSPEQLRWRPQHVVIQRDVIRRRARWPFIDHDKLWEWTLLHEMGHVVRVPADAAHAFTKGRGAHCTYPTCVMYSPADVRLILTGLKHGWPLEFCVACTAEIAAGQAAR